MPQEPIAMASPVALVINPAVEDEGLLYYKTDKSQLAIEHRPLYQDDYTTFKDNNPVNGPIINPGCFAAVVRRGLVDVYGFTEYRKDAAPGAAPGAAAGTGTGTAAATGIDPNNPADGGATAYVISQLSPVYNPISVLKETQSGYAGLAAVNDTKSSNWLYYIRFAADPKTPQTLNPKIHEFMDTYAGNKTPTILRKTKPSKHSKLAAIYHPDTGSRSVFYQAIPDDDDNTLITMFSPKIKEDPITIYNTGTAFLGTPIAVTSSGKGADLIMWLYYMTTTSDLWRVVYRKGVWGSPKDVASVGDDKMRKSTSLTVALHKEHNHIWFIKSDASGDVYTGYKDPLDADL